MRICSCCGNKMYKGIYVETTGEYFCSDDCMNTKYSNREYEKMYKDGEAYWTTFD